MLIIVVWLVVELQSLARMISATATEVEARVSNAGPFSDGGEDGTWRPVDCVCVCVCGCRCRSLTLLIVGS